MGSDPVKSRSQQNLEAFQSTLPGWGATLRGVVPYLTCYTFQSTLPGWGATIESTGNATDVMIFQSTLPGWGATHNSSLGMVANSQFQSTLPGWGATEARHPTRSPVRYFNPRSPDGERRFARECRSQTFLFQSTLPGWGATPMISTRVLPRTNFNPRSPDGERRSDHCRCHYRPEISIHAPRMGSDYAPLICFNVCSIFQSTLPGWGATFSKSTRRKTMTKFQSTLPGWGATCARCSRASRSPFQSTLPGWGATAKMDIFAHDMGKIIHFQH